MIRKLKRRSGIVLFLLIFVIMLAVGRYTYQDYGRTLDEDAEWLSSTVNYQHIVKTLTGREIRVWDLDIDELIDRYYGVALQLPMVFLEDLTGFTMPLHEMLRLKHLYIFCVCMAGWACFFVFLRKIFKSDWLALLGFLLITLYPRFWGEQFTNMKDVFFAVTCCVELLAIALCLEHEGNWACELLAAAAGAFCANARFVGFQLPAFLLGYRVIRDWWLTGIPKGERGRWFLRTLPRYLAQIVLMFLVYFAIAPASWADPIDFLKNVFRIFSNYDSWEGNVPFLGRVYQGYNNPWYYLPVWVLISMPLWYLALMGIGGALPVAKLLRKGEKGKFKKLLLDDTRYLVLCLAVFLIPMITPLFKVVTLYNAWRHVYYIVPFMIVIALYGVRWLFERLSGHNALRRTLAGAMAVLLAGQGVWIALNHPLEKVYFNPVGRAFADGVDRDYWYESDTHLLKVILENDPTPRITVNSECYIDETISYFFSPEEDRRLYRKYGFPDTLDYIICSAEWLGPMELDGFVPVYELRMRDGLLISTLYMRKTLLEERFGGVYPQYNVK